MEIIQNQAVKITVSEHIAPHITKNIQKSEVLQYRDNLAEMLVYWGVPEMTKLHQIVNFKETLP